MRPPKSGRMTRGADPETRSDARIGIFGGTFDPPHLGHAAAATDVADALELDRLIWVPARRSPHKSDQPLTADPIRLEMVGVSTSLDPRFEVSDCELRRPAPSYAVDTLRWLRGKVGPTAQLFLIMGIDQYRAFDRWRAPDEIRSLATLVVMDREGQHAPPGPDDGAEFMRVAVRRVDASSTEIRRRVASGASPEGLVLPGVADIIEREGLYRG